MNTYDSDWFAKAPNAKDAFCHHFRDGHAELTSGDTMPVTFVKDEEIRNYKIKSVFCPAEHRWLTASIRRD